MNINIRDEVPTDIEVIRHVTKSAFENAVHKSRTEHFIIDALRHSNQLTISMVAVLDDIIVGHIAFSPVSISGDAKGWYGLGPISVVPYHQGQGVGSRLVAEGLYKLRALKAHGCFALGDPGFYSRFGFAVHQGLEYPGVPPEYFMVLSFINELPQGKVTYHASFEVAP